MSLVVGMAVVLVVMLAGSRLRLRLPAVTADEYVLDALVGWELAGLAGPRGGEGATVHVLDLGGVARLIDGGQLCSGG
jgi:hypothetical protein